MITPMLGEGQGSHHKGYGKGHGKEQYQAVDMKTMYYGVHSRSEYAFA